jgi:hypothetical protein
LRLFGRRVVKMWEGEPDEAKIELELFEIGCFIDLWIEVAVLIDNSVDLLRQEGLLIKRCLLYGLIQKA